jgi:peptidoglycan hydrolase CwlO-like protein
MKAFFVRIIPVLLVTLLLLKLVTHIISAEEEVNPDEIKKEYEDVHAEIERLQQQISIVQSQERTLSNQILQFNSQIQVTTLQVAETRKQIELLTSEISILQANIDGLEISLEKVSNLIVDRAVRTYQRGAVTPLKLLVVSEGFDLFVTRYAYLSYLQNYDKQILLQLQQNQDTINDRKKELEIKQQEVEKKKKQLETLKAQLDGQKRAKEALLEVTKNDEARYRKLLEAAQSRESELARLIFRDGKVGYSMAIFGLTKRGSVSKGERIGTMGNSGYPRCSSAAHLHMEVIEKGTVGQAEVVGELINPFAYLKNRNISYFKSDNNLEVRSLGAGSWDWPLNEPVITQDFGKTPWSSRYLSGFHTGIDMVDYNDRSVRAPASGTLYYAKIACGNAINVGVIDHGGGIISQFLHLE